MCLINDERFSISTVLKNATALGSRIPPHAVLLQVNENTPVKLKIIFAIVKNGVHLRNDVRTIIYIYIYRQRGQLNRLGSSLRSQ